MKYFGCSYNEVLWEMTWYQVMTLIGTIPKYDYEQGKNGKEKITGPTVHMANLFGRPPKKA